jgi:hypothetical protein
MFYKKSKQTLKWNFLSQHKQHTISRIKIMINGHSLHFVPIYWYVEEYRTIHLKHFATSHHSYAYAMVGCTADFKYFGQTAKFPHMFLPYINVWKHQIAFHSFLLVLKTLRSRIPSTDFVSECTHSGFLWLYALSLYSLVFVYVT